MKSILTILLGFTFILSLNGHIWGAESPDSALLGEKALNQSGTSLQNENEPSSAGSIFLNKGQIDHLSIRVFERTQPDGFSPESRRKDPVLAQANRLKLGTSDSTSVAIYLTGIGFFFFVGLARRGVLPLFKSY